jgi:thiamine kinase-like enzyme
MDYAHICRYAVESASLRYASCCLLSKGVNRVFLCSTESPNQEQVVVRIPHKSIFWTEEHFEAKYRSEALAMNFASQQLDGYASVPKVLSVGVEPVSGLPFLLMEFVQGAQTLRKAGDEEKLRYAGQIVELVAHLCQLKPPFQSIGGFNNSPLWFDGPPLGPFASMNEFVSEMLKWSAERIRPQDSELSELLNAYPRPTDGKHYSLVFRHGDLSIDNILVRDGILWLIDWEWSGVYDERDVWLELRELCIALGAEHLWNPPISRHELDQFDALKDTFMGVAWAATFPDGTEELDYLKSQIILNQF